MTAEQESASDEERGRSPQSCLIAYHTGDAPLPTIVPAPTARQWMHATFAGFAQRCLPLLIANQSGWWILNRTGFRATWNGTPVRAGVAIEPLDPAQPATDVGCQFGYGIVTWTIPVLFRTAPGYNLLVRGPANLPKRGAVALEGVVETDWAVATFTMNWQLMVPGESVVFEAGEPFCMIVPQRRGELESFRPETRRLDEDPELARQFRAWEEERELHQIVRRVALDRLGPDHPETKSWQGDYFRGRSPGGESAAEHQTRLSLRPFEPRAGGGDLP